MIQDKTQDNIILLKKHYRSKQKHIPTYLLKCHPKNIKGTETIDIKPYYDEFIHNALQIIKGQMDWYDKPIVIKIYNIYSRELRKELEVYNRLLNSNFYNHLAPLCIINCNDLQEKYKNSIQNNIKLCSTGEYDNMMVFIVNEYINTGDISNFISVNNIKSKNIIIDVILQLICSLTILLMDFNIYHGDLNTGNVLIAKTNKDFFEYKIYNNTYKIKTHGYKVVFIDFGMSIMFPDFEYFHLLEQIETALFNLLPYYMFKSKSSKISKIIFDKDHLNNDFTYLLKDVSNLLNKEINIYS